MLDSEDQNSGIGWRLKVLLEIVQWTWDTAIVQCKQTNLTQIVTRETIFFVTTLNILFVLFWIFITETFSRTDESQPRPKYVFNKMWNYNIYFNYSIWGLVHHYKRISNTSSYCFYGVFLFQSFLVLTVHNKKWVVICFS